VGVFSPRAFSSRRPQGLQTWRSVATPAMVEFSRRDYFARGAFRFDRAEFLVDGVLPRPAMGNEERRTKTEGRGTKS
jgi:hypothetical protein